jgi:hypothetical protein
MSQNTPDILNLPIVKSFKSTSDGSPITDCSPQQCGNFNIRIDRDGIWYYQNSPISRLGLVKLFSSVLSQDETGNYWMTTPVERGTIEVEDVPFLAVDLDMENSGPSQVLSIRTNLDEVVTLDEDHPLTIITNPNTAEPIPYITIRDNLKARLTRPVYYDVVDLGLEEKINGEKLFGVWSAGVFFPMGKLTEDDGE